MILFVGDTHCPIDIRKLDNSHVKSTCGGVFPHYVIICGDFGAIWSNNVQDEQEQYWLNWLDSKPFKILFCAGNHENFSRLNNFPKVNMFDSEVRQISDNVFQLLNGHIYSIDSHKIFVMGGATSTDKHLRTPYIDWWPEEVPTYADYNLAIENLQKNNYIVNYVVTHTAPASVLKEKFTYSDRYEDPTSDMLEDLTNRIVCDKWFFGHMHEDMVFDFHGKEFHALYKNMFYVV